MARRTTKKEETEKKQCVTCKKEKAVTTQNFYKSSMPLVTDGWFFSCKDCINYLVDSSNINSVLWMLRTMDKPFIESLWDASMKEVTERGWTQWGSYMKNIAMPQYQGLTWDNSDNTSNIIASKIQSAPNKNDTQNKNEKTNKNKEEKIYSQQWMGSYSESDLEYLDNYLKNLHSDFKIINANHRDYAQKIAKASLHMDRCFQDMTNGVSGAESKYKVAKEVFDTLSKSAQFAESGRGQNDVSLGCFGKVFEKVENKTYIYEHVPLKKDDYDKVIDDLQHILKSV